MAPLVENEDFYKDLDPILDIINKKIVRMDESMKKKYVKIMLEVVNIAIEGMKEIDEVFDKLYSTTQFVGSYFDGLRVAKPTEFDINLIMNMPCDQEKLQFEIDQMTPGLAKINIGKALKRDQLPEKVLRTVDNWCDKEGYILIDKVNAWLESVLTRFFGQAAKTLSLPSKQTVKVKFRKAGPAFTLNIEVGSDFIDVDLVCTILYYETMEPPSPIPIKWTDELSAYWVLVPKPSNDSRLWRVSFPDSEKKLLHNKNKLKLINRFLKALRDAQNFQFPSYFIKILFLWEAYKCLTQNRNGFWEKRQGYLFIYMLYVLYSTLNNKLLPYIWQKECNLYDRLNPDHLTNVANRISHIISKINDLIVKKDNDGLKSYISDLFTNEELGFANLNLS